MLAKSPAYLLIKVPRYGEVAVTQREPARDQVLNSLPNERPT